MIDRRQFTVIALAGAVAPLTGGAAIAAPAIGSIRVEVGRLAAKGQGATAALVKPAMERELASLRTAGRGRGQGATLVVDVTGLYLTSYAGGAAATLGNDTLESEARLIGADGRLLASYPILAIMAPSFGGAWYRPDGTERRIAALVTSNAQWIKRYFGG